VLINVLRIFASPPSLVSLLSEVHLHWFSQYVVEAIAISFEERSLAASRLTAMSLAYKVEELLALSDSVSESAVSIDKFANEDVIKGQCWVHFHLHRPSCDDPPPHTSCHYHRPKIILWLPRQRIVPPDLPLAPFHTFLASTSSLLLRPRHLRPFC
jgi:hypothetical protein